jgi:Xaa-Pro dipeptidase
MPQTNTVTEETFRARIEKAQQTMREFGLRAIVMEGGAAMSYFTGVRWGRSERTFAVVLPDKGELAYVVPGFEKMRAEELIRVGKDIRTWEEDESPYQKIAKVLQDRGVTAGRIGFDDTVRFFIFDGVRKEAPKLEYVNAAPALKAAGVTAPPPSGRR